MPISLALDPTHLKSTLPSFNFGHEALDTDLLSEEEADRLLSNLVQARWSRLACQDTDPLGMLFNDCAKQWTAGWEPQQQALLLLVWETDSWQNKPKWSLYRNGKLIFQALDGASAQRRQCLNQLLESPNLPFIEPAEFLARFSDFRFSETQRLQAVEQLRQTVDILPAILEPIKITLFNILETDLGNPEWPMLEVLKLHRLSHKNPLVTLFRDWIQQGHMANSSDTTRFTQALHQLNQDYLFQGPKIQPLFQATYQQAYQEFRTLFTNCLWRIQMRQTHTNASTKPLSTAVPISF